MYPPWLRIKSAYVAVFGTRCVGSVTVSWRAFTCVIQATTTRRFRGVFDNLSPLGLSFEEMPSEYFSQILP